MHSTPTELGESVFLSLKKADAEGFSKLFPSADQVEEIARLQSPEGADYTERMKQLDGAYVKLRERSCRTFYFCGS